MAIIGGAAVAAVGTVAAGAMSSDASRSAANKQNDAAKLANDQQRADRKPWTDAGTGALGTLTSGLQPGGQFAAPFSMADANNSEAEKHALSEGKSAIENSAAARGGLINTNSMHDLTKFAEGTAATYENQAFNQWLQSRQQGLNANESLAGLGMTSAQNTADSTSNLTLASGNAMAAGRVGEANGIGGAVGGIGNQISMLSGLFGKNSSVKTTDMGSGVDLNAASTAAMGGSGGADAYGDYSDERMKEGLKKVGKTDGGLPIYTYRMKGGGPTKMGVLAQHVEKLAPSLVSEDKHGMKMVDYAGVA